MYGHLRHQMIAEARTMGDVGQFTQTLNPKP